jgi:hypothetical protein
MVWRRPALAARARPAEEPEAVQAPGAVAKRASRNILDEELELDLRDDPMPGDDLEQPKVKPRNR